MKLVYPEIDFVFETDIEKVNTIVIENPTLFYNLLVDINNQLNGDDGKTVLSIDDKIVDIKNKLCILDHFVPFDINEKNIINKIATNIEKLALSNNNYVLTMEILSSIEKYLYDISFDLNCNIDFAKINVPSLIKSAGIEIRDDYTSLLEKILDYMELVKEFDGEKMFITINLRSFVKDDELFCFLDSVKKRNFHLIMIENKENNLLDNENRYIIDSSLCEIK